MKKENLNPNKNPIAIVLTDTHMEEDTIDINVSVFRQAREIAKALGLLCVFHMGDIFDSRKGQPQSVLVAFQRILDQFESDGMKLVAIPGNHDKTNYASCDSFLDPYITHPAFELHRTPQDVVLTKNIIATMMPFFNDGVYSDALWSWEEGDGKITFEGNLRQRRVLMTHIGVDGAVMNNGRIVESGIKPAMFKHWDRVLIGHYHDASGMYVGSSIQHNFGETKEKGLTLLNDDLTTETIELKFPRYIKYDVDVKKLNLKDIEDLKEETANGDHIRVVLCGEEKDIKAYDATKLKLAGIDVKKKEEVIIEEELEERVDAFTASTLSSAFKEFCKKNDLNEQTGLKYLNTAI